MFIYYLNLQNNASLSVPCIWFDIMHAQHIETKWFTCFLQVEHTQKWEQFLNSQPSTENTTNEDPISKRDFWVAQNLNSKGRVYGFRSEGLVMKQQSCRSTSARSSSVNNYDAWEMAIRFNESIAKDAEDARQEELRCKIEAKVTQKLVTNS